MEIGIDKRILKEANCIWYILLSSLITIWLGTWLGYYFFIHGYAYSHPGNIVQALINWDARWYMDIARHGYACGANGQIKKDVAFFPLYPIIMKVLSLIFGFRNGVATILPAMSFGMASIYLFYKLAKTKLTESGALFATAAYALYPGAAFFVSSYPTSLMNLLVIVALLAFGRKYYMTSAAAAGLSTAAGPLLVFLSVTLFLSFARSMAIQKSPITLFQIMKTALFGLLSLFGILCFMLYQNTALGTPFAFINVQSAWGTATTLHRLWNIITLYPIFGGGYGDFFRSIIFAQRGIKSPQVSTEDVFNSLSIIMALLSTWVLFQSKEYMLSIYSFLVVSGYAWFIASIQGTISTFRLLYVDIPMFIAAGILYQKPRRHLSGYALLFMSAVALMLQSAFFVSGYWAF